MVIDGKILGKPENREDAMSMLKMLSGNKHQVLTGVCIRSRDKMKSFTSLTDVYFKNLDIEEIDYYLHECEPYDKAGAYGIQEWIGYTGITRIEGSSVSPALPSPDIVVSGIRSSTVPSACPSPL